MAPTIFDSFHNAVFPRRGLWTPLWRNARTAALWCALLTLAAVTLVPNAAPACIGSLPSFQQIDAALATANLPSDQLARARELHELLRSGNANEGKRAFDELVKLLGLDKAAGNARC